MATRNNVIMASSYKGGAGKSTIAMNLAAALQQSGADVVVVDLDGHSRTAMTWRQNWFAENPQAEEQGKVPPLPQVLQILDNVADPIEKLSANHDYVVVDAGAGAPRQNQEAIRAADLLLIPVTPSQFDIDPTMKYIFEIAAAQRKFGGRPKARVVFTRVAKGKASSIELAEAFRGGGVPIPPLKTEIPARESLTRLLGAGVSVYHYPRASDLREIFDKLAAEVLKALAEPVAQSNSKPAAAAAANA